MYVDKYGLVEHYYGPAGRVVLPPSVRELGTELFLDREDITEVVLNKGLETIGILAFCGTGIHSIDIPDSVDWISIGAFARCKNLTAVRLPKFMYMVDMDLFYDCENLRKVILPEILDEIEQDAFAYCTSLTEIDFPDTLGSIGARSFANAGLKALRIPASVTTIETEAFVDCYDLSRVLIEGKEVFIADDAFPEEVILTAPYIPPEKLPEGNRLLSVVGFAEWCAEGNVPSHTAMNAYRFYLRTHAKDFYRFAAEYPAVGSLLASEGLLPGELIDQLKMGSLSAIEALFQNITEN